jgi:hypothetical protein
MEKANRVEIKVKAKVKFTPEHGTKDERGSRGMAPLLLFFLKSHTPAALLPGKTRYPLYRRLGELQGHSGRVRTISSLPGFDPRTV